MVSHGSQLNPYAAPWEAPSAMARACRGFPLNSNAAVWFPPSTTVSGTDQFGNYNLWAGSSFKSLHQKAGLPYRESWSLFAVHPVQHLQQQFGGGCFVVQVQLHEESWEMSQWMPQQLCPKGHTVVPTPDTEVSSTASGSAASLGDVESDSEITTSPTESIDSLTSVPCDLFDRLVHAGAAARQRGQHRRVRSPGGTIRLRSADAALFRQLPACAPSPPSHLPGTQRVGPCPTGAPPPPPPLGAGM